jgi:hypothetical protein
MTRYDFAARLGSLAEYADAPGDYWTDGQTVLTGEWKPDARGIMQPVSRPRIAIPKQAVLPDDRAAYDRRFEEAVRRAFPKAGGFIDVPVEQPDVHDSLLTRRVENVNDVKVPERFAMYRAMLRAGETLPPVVVSVTAGPDGAPRYKVLDGNHRWYAAQAEGAPFVRGVQLQGLGTFSGLLMGGVR